MCVVASAGALVGLQVVVLTIVAYVAILAFHPRVNPKNVLPSTLRLRNCEISLNSRTVRLICITTFGLKHR